MAVANPTDEDQRQENSDEKPSADYKIIKVDSDNFRDFLPDEGEQVNQMLESAYTYAEKFNEIKELMKEAETEYRSMHKNAAINDVHGYDERNWINMNESETSLINLETRILDELDEFKEYSSRDNKMDALKEGIWTYAGVQLITIPENQYVGFDTDQDIVSDLRSYSNATVNKNPAPHPLKGYVSQFGETEDELVIEIGTENVYGTLKDLEEGKELESIFDETNIAEKERKSVEIEERSREYNNPKSYEAWMDVNNIDRELDTDIGEGRTRGIY